MNYCPHVTSGCNYPEGECNGACMKKQPEVLRLADELDAALYSSDCTNDSANELRRLHALCEEQKRLLEQALVGMTMHHTDPGYQEQRIKAMVAITNHLRQQEGEKQ